MKTIEEVLSRFHKDARNLEMRAEVEALLRDCARDNYINSITVTQGSTRTTTTYGTVEDRGMHTVMISFDTPKVPESIRLDVEPLGVVCGTRESYADAVWHAFDTGLRVLKDLRPHLTEETALARCDAMIAAWSEVVGRLEAPKASAAEKA